MTKYKIVILFILTTYAIVFHTIFILDRPKKINVVSVVVFRQATSFPSTCDGKHPIYLEGLKRFASNFPVGNWYLRVYVDDNMQDDPIIAQLRNNPYVQIVRYDFPQLKSQGYHLGFIPTIARFLPLFDPDVGAVIVRDIDGDFFDLDRNISIPPNTFHMYKIPGGYKHKKVSDCIHQYYDGSFLETNGVIPAGMFGLSGALPPSLWEKILDDLANDPKKFCIDNMQDNLYGIDEIILNTYIIEEILKEHKILIQPWTDASDAMEDLQKP
jgi:hypothetical protein